MWTYLPVAKVGAQCVAGLGVSKIIADIVKNNVTVVTTADAVKVWTGTFVLTSMLVEQSSNHIDRAADGVAAWLESRKTEKETEK